MGNVWRQIWLSQPKRRVLLAASEWRTGCCSAPTTHRTAPQQRATRANPAVPRLRNRQESRSSKDDTGSVNYKIEFFKIEFLHDSNPNRYVASVVGNEPVMVAWGHVIVMNWHAAMCFMIICSIKEVKSDPVINVVALRSLFTPCTHQLSIHYRVGLRGTENKNKLQ